MIKFFYSMPIRREKEDFMKRKKSEQWLEEDDLICPDCDENEEFLPETEKKERKKIQWTKKNITKCILHSVLQGFLEHS